jgi:hypothetical protein
LLLNFKEAKLSWKRVVRGEPEKAPMLGGEMATDFTVTANDKRKITFES